MSTYLSDYTPTSDEDVLQKPHLSFVLWLLGFVLKSSSSSSFSRRMSEKHLKQLFPWIKHALRTPHMSVKEKMFNLICGILKVK